VNNFKMVKLGDLFLITKGRKEILSDKKENKTQRYIQIEDLRNSNNLKYCIPTKQSNCINVDNLIIAWDGANAGFFKRDGK